MMVQLWKWFTGWAEGFGIVVPPADGPLVYRLVSAKLTAQMEEEGLTLASLYFFPSHSSINLCSSSSIFFAYLFNAELIIF
jgi:hypothetical protein